jgi:ligand-binding sensor domain-containing protein/signal transduction histidine kinase
MRVASVKPRALLGVVLMACPSAFALNPSLDVSQYAHTSWKIRDGFPKGEVNSIAQTPDGWLWLGTEFGLLRFDGVTPTAFQPPPGQHLPSDNILRLLVARDGTLWISTAKGLAGWKNGRLTQYAELGETPIDTMLEDREGSVWVGTQSPGKLCAIRDGRVRCEGEGRLGPGVNGLHESPDGTLWMGVLNGLWRWKPGPPRFYPLPGEINGIQAFAEDGNGALTIGTHSGLMRFADAKSEPHAVPGVAAGLDVHLLLRDRDGGLWLGTTNQGLLHLHQGLVDVFGPREGLLGDQVLALFEDREGSLWVSTVNGLERLRDYAVATFSQNQELSSTTVGAVLADRDGSVWIDTLDGLNRWKRGQFTVYRTRQGRGTPASSTVREIAGTGLPDRYIESLFQDGRGRMWVATNDGVGYLENDRFTLIKGTGGLTHAFAQDAGGNLWIAHQQLGLLRLSPGSELARIPLAGVPPNAIASALLADSARGDLWIGFFPVGLVRYRDGQVRASYGIAEGLGAGQVAGLRLDSDGTLWADTGGGLSRLRNGRIVTLNSRSGLPCDGVHWSMEDDAHALWLYMPCGLVRIARSEMDAWNNDARHTIRYSLFDGSDGVRTIARPGGFTPHAGKSPDGKIWFAARDGASVIDPLHLAFNKLPPPVYVGQITADRKVYDASPGRHLPPLIRDLEIDYTALSLVAPEKNRFRYKLEGYDTDWQDPATRRQAFYTNLSPRRYRFRVQASNNSGVWNEAGASFDFSIDPAWYQTLWFLAAAVAAFLAMLWGLYRYRLHQLSRQFGMRMEERVNERTRIARDLHDTLLQGFQGVLLKFSAVSYMLPDDSRAREVLEQGIDQARKSIEEGRDAVQGLRTSTLASNDLARTIGTIGEELAADRLDGRRPGFRIEVEGAPTDLAPLVRDEVCRIVVEALRNAFRHADAAQIEVAIHYEKHCLRIQVRDDGKGVDQSVLEAGGREGHHGLKGMHERASLIRGKLEVWSKSGFGCEVELTVPASVAYAGPHVQERRVS